MGLYEQIEQELDVGLAFKDHLIPDAIKWFTGEAEDEDEEGDEDEEEDEEDEGDEEEPPAGKKAGKTDEAMAKAFGKATISDGAAGSGPTGNPEPPKECNQQ